MRCAFLLYVCNKISLFKVVAKPIITFISLFKVFSTDIFWSLSYSRMIFQGLLAILITAGHHTINWMYLEEAFVRANEDTVDIKRKRGWMPEQVQLLISGCMITFIIVIIGWQVLGNLNLYTLFDVYKREFYRTKCWNCYFCFQRERTRRVLFIWKASVAEQRERAAHIRRNNQALVFNILPPHVAAHFMQSRRLKHSQLYSQSYAETGVLFASIPNFAGEKVK